VEPQRHTLAQAIPAAVKKLMYTVRVDDPDPKFGNMLLEQFGGANGELAAAMQYSVQGLNCEDAERKDLLMDIGTEELSHLEIVGALARLHLKPMKFDRESAEADPLIAIGTLASLPVLIIFRPPEPLSIPEGAPLATAGSPRPLSKKGAS
jgi:Mn-containing catalase